LRFKKFWAVTIEKVLVHNEYKVFYQIVALRFSQSEGPSLQLFPEQRPTIILAELVLLQ